MEIEPDLVVEDNARLGKRKRSPEKKPHPIQDPLPPELDIHRASPSSQENAQATPKRTRVEIIAAQSDQDRWPKPGLGHGHDQTIFSIPIEVLQHILSFLAPAMLCRLMGVNRYFYSLLDPYGKPTVPSEKTRLPLLTAELIWSCSRKSYLPGVPHPLKSVTELDMLRLIYGRRCQFCGKLPASNPPKLRTTPWDSGPGPLGVRTIWPFKIKTCAECLRPLLAKETELMHPGYSHLLNGLLSATFSPSLNYVMSISLNQSALPPGLQLTRYYYRKDIDYLSLQASKAHSLGNGAYDRWYRELDALRQEADTDVLRLEAWEIAQNPASSSLVMSSNVTSRSSASGSSVYSDGRSKSFATAPSGGYRALVAASAHGGATSARSSGSFTRFDPVRRGLLPRTELESTFNKAAENTRKFTSQLPTQQADESLQSQSNYISPDLTRLKTEKQFDIQQRCMELIPPITPDVLHQLPAFQAALRVLMPLNDASWEALKIQLINQLMSVEPTHPVGHGSNPQPDTVDTGSVWREITPTVGDVEIDLRRQALRPVREKLYDFAREYVHRRYADGTGLTHASAPQFAADVLLYVRQRFYENQEQEDAAFTAHGEQPPDEGASGMRARTLRLEHMRYVFETSIKPFTEFVRKDLFLCSACDTQGRHFAFEAIIQHYASKHTDAFSRGSAVVYWKAIWPAEPPFQRQPSRDVDSAPSGSHTISARGPASVQAHHLADPGVISRLGEDYDSGTIYRDEDQLNGPSQVGFGGRRLLYDAYRHDGTSTVPSLYRNVSPYPRLNIGRAGYSTQSEDASKLSLSQPGAAGATHMSSRDFKESPLQVYDPYPDASVLQDREQYCEDVPMTEAGESTLTDTRSSFGGKIISRPRGVIYDRPLSDVHHREDSPAQYNIEFGPRRELYSAAAYVQQRSAAERFLDTFDDDVAPEHARELRGPMSTRLQRPSSTGNLERQTDLLDHRSNISQPRRRFGIVSASENEHLVERLYPTDMIPRDIQDSIREHRTITHFDNERNYPLYRDESYPNPDTYGTSPDERPGVYRVLQDSPRFYEGHHHRHRTHHIDQYGREIQSVSPEVIYSDGQRYQDSRSDRRMYLNEPQVRYQYIPYDERIPGRNTGYEPYYIDRPLGETQARHRYEGEQPPRRATTHDHEDARQFHHSSSRPPMNDQRYGRNPEER